MPNICPFFGPNMRAVIDWAKISGCYDGSMSLYQFGQMMDEMTGVKHAPDDGPEVAAAKWLGGLGISQQRD